MAVVTLPLKIDFNTWACQIQQDLPKLNIQTPPDKVSGWQDWAAQVVVDARLKNVPMPTKLAYPGDEDWRIWADYFIDSVYNIT